MDHDDETSITEISIASDGRIYVFGASQAVLEALDDLELGDRSVAERVALVRSLAAASPPETCTNTKRPAHGNGPIQRIKHDGLKP